MYNIVLIGCGHMGMVHLDDIYTMENVNIYAVVDISTTALELEEVIFNLYKEYEL